MLRSFLLVTTLLLASNAAESNESTFLPPLQETTSYIQTHRQSETGRSPYNFPSQQTQTRAFNRVTRALPHLFELDQRILRIEQNIARIIQTQGHNLQSLHMNQIRRLADIHSQYMATRNRFTAAVQSVPTLHGDVSRHMREMRNQLRRTNSPRNADLRVQNYQSGNIARLIKVDGDYGVRQLMENLRTGRGQGMEYLRREVTKIYNQFVQRTGGQPSARPRTGPRIPGTQIPESTPHVSQ